MRTNIFLSESVNYVFVFVMMSSKENETERWGCNEEGARWGAGVCGVCAWVGGIQKRKRAVVPITD